MTTGDLYDEMVQKWHSAVVTRSEVYNFTGGLMRGSFLANLDSKGAGPPRQRSGQKWLYATRSFADWLRDRSAAKQ